ncbi:SH3 domain-containing protein 21 isoform X2 [Microtus oregoni]|uniref:SH3 domain-containing protein 21 isoform X2 n=1 Tax=Microtus oregoni TaxID=111838 RepID=UPI001BB224B6|nr:SH3 domain-containing protein 21 isoform X2 [Microtus oregoni]
MSRDVPQPFLARPPPAEVLVLARYRAQTEDELSLAPGDVVRQVRAGTARGWLHGTLQGRHGLFPKRLVQEIPEALRGVTEPRPRCARLRRGHPVNFQGPQRWCKVNFNYSPEQADELKLQTGEIVEVIKEIEDGWWLGKKNGQLGAFPSNFVELLDGGPPSLGSADMPSDVPNPPKPPKLSNLTYDSPPDYLRTVSCPETCRVLFDYQPEAPDELALHKGDLVKVLRKTTEDKGWWEGECQGRRGLFPDNFVLPPPPIRKLVPRKIISRDSPPVKESKKLMPRTSLPTVKRLAAAASAPSKVKTSSTPSGDSQKRPSRDAGFNGSFLNGGARQPGRKRPGTQASQQHPVSSQEDDQRSPGKAPSTNKTPTPDKTRLPDKTLDPEKNPAPNKVSTPENRVPEKALDSDKIPTAENTAVDTAVTTGGALSGDEAPALKSPTKEEIFDPKAALPVDTAPALVKILTPEHMVFEEDPSKENTQCQHLPPEETTQGSQSLAPPNDIQVPGQHFQGSNPSERSCCKMKHGHGDNCPAHSKPEDEAAVTGLPAKDETARKEPLPKELPSEGVSPPKQVPPKESVPTPQVPHTIKRMPDAEGAPTLHPVVPLTSSESASASADAMDVASLKEEVRSLKSKLELLELKLEQKMSDVWKELKAASEKIELLEVRTMQRTKKSFKQAQTQTETQPAE